MWTYNSAVGELIFNNNIHDFVNFILPLPLASKSHATELHGAVVKIQNSHWQGHGFKSECESGAVVSLGKALYPHFVVHQRGFRVIVPLVTFS